MSKFKHAVLWTVILLISVLILGAAQVFKVTTPGDILYSVLALALIQGVPLLIQRAQDRPNPFGVIFGSVVMSRIMVTHLRDSDGSIAGNIAAGIMYMWSLYLIFPSKEGFVTRLGIGMTAPVFIALFLAVMVSGGAALLPGMVIAFIMALIAVLAAGGIFYHGVRIYERAIDRIISRWFSAQKEKRKNDYSPVNTLELSEDEQQLTPLPDERADSYAALIQ